MSDTGGDAGDAELNNFDSSVSLLTNDPSPTAVRPKYGTIQQGTALELMDISGSETPVTSEGTRADNVERNLSSYGHEIWVALLVITGGIAFGITFAYTSAVVPVLKDTGVLTGQEASMFESMLLLGGLCGSLISAFAVEFAGRKKTSLLTAIPYICGWGCLIGAREKILLYIGRFLTGIGNGSLCVAFGLYAAEVISKDIRGRVLVGFHVGATIGILAGYILGLFIDKNWLAFASTVPVGLMVAGALFLPESPRWLLLKHRPVEAENGLMWFRMADRAAVGDELSEIVTNVEAQSKPSVSEIIGDFRKSIRSVLIVVTLIGLNQLSGISLVLFNIEDIFDAAGYTSGTSASRFAILTVGAVKFAVTFISAGLVDKLGRRPPFMFGGVLMGLGGLLFGFYFHYPNTFSDNFQWIPILCLALYAVGYGIGWGGVVWLLVPEILPLRIRGYGSGLASGLSWAFGFIFASEYQTILDAVSMAGLFWIFGSVCLFSVVYAYAILPETNQRSLEDIEQSSSRGSKDIHNN